MKTSKTSILIVFTFIFLACSQKNRQAKTKLIRSENTFTQQVGAAEKTSFIISKSLNQAKPKTDLQLNFIYTNNTQNTSIFKPLPNGYNDNIKSFVLPKGYMVTFAENADGTGESICYVAAISDVKENLPSRMSDKVSFVRFIPIKYTTKKGLGGSADINVLDASWYYNWGLSATSTKTKTYVPMTWGKTGVNAKNIATFIARTDIDHLLAFNEPDNAKQSNIASIDTAIARYKLLLQTGLRMGSPAVEQDHASGKGKWLPNFMEMAASQNLRVDVIALHWYDWGNQKKELATPQLTAEAVFGRFKNYVEKHHAIYPNHNLWFTEFNCNPARSEEVHKIFMKLATDYLNQLDYVERYAYFFPAGLLPTTGAPNYTLTDLGKTWNDIVAPPAYTHNIIPN